MLNKTFLSSFLCSIILSGIITTAVSVGSWDSLHRVNAQLDSKSRVTAEAAIKKAYDALVTAGLKGTPGALISTGDGFAKVFRDIKGAIVFVIFWTPSTGAHALSGAIMQTYKSEGWHLSDLGYPKSDEKDLAGVTNGRYNEFQNGVIAMIKGKNAQVFPTVKDAVAKLGQGAIKSPSLAETEIKKAYDALVAAGLKGTPSALRDTGEGYLKVFRDSNGVIVFVIFWTPSTGAHAISGSIMQAYKSEGWYLSDLGYPTSDEKDLTGVTNGRYNEFQNGVIAMIKGQEGQVFPTVEDAVTNLKITQGTEPQVPVSGKYRMTLEVVVFGGAGTRDDKISAGFAIKPDNGQPILLTDSLTPDQLQHPAESPRDIGIKTQDFSLTDGSLSFSYVVTNKLGRATQSDAIDVAKLPLTILSSQGTTESIAAAQTFLPQSVIENKLPGGGCEFIIAVDEKVFTAEEFGKKISQQRTSETKDGLVQTTGGGLISGQRVFDVKAPTGCAINYKMVGTIWTIRDLAILPSQS